MSTRQHKATIYDVAKDAKVSTATVSRVLSGNENIYIKDTTKKRVLNSVKKLNYILNPFAANLSKKRSNLLALVYEGSDALFSSFYHVQLAQATYDVLAETDFNLILYAPKDNQFEHVGLELRSQGVEGVIIEAGRLKEKYILNLEKAKFPYVLTGQKIENEKINNVYIDNYGGLRVAFEYLYSLGHKKIGYVHSNLNFTANKERYRAYRDSLAAHKLKFRKSYEIISCEGIKSGDESLDKILKIKNRPTAFLCENDEKAVGLIQSAFRHNIMIPDEFSIMGFDDIILSNYVEPELTTMRIPMNEVAEKAIGHLIDLIENSKWKNIRTEVMPRLVERHSCRAI